MKRFLLLLALLSLLTTCSADIEEIKFQDNKLVELSSDSDNRVVFGVISDIHGEVDKARVMIKKLKKKGADFIIVPGDLTKNERLRQGTGTDNDYEELKAVLNVLGNSKLTIFVTPGNHENQEDYDRAMAEAPGNVVDMTKTRIFDGDDADLVAIPGYPDEAYIPERGFWASPAIIYDVAEIAKGLDGPIIIVSHSTPKTLAGGPGTAYTNEDAGNELIREVMIENNITFSVSGHIHESGGIGASFDGLVAENEWSPVLLVNFGTLEEWAYLDGKTRQGMAGIFTVENKSAKFEMLELE